jgi:hypothetical protein
MPSRERRAAEVFPYVFWGGGSKIVAVMAAHSGKLLSHLQSLAGQMADVVLQSFFHHRQA